ncbi:MAG: DUF1444 family protein [Planctomycetaceae bacterium]
MSGNWSVEMEFDRHTDPRFDGWRLCRGPANWFTFLCPDLIEVRQTQTVIELRMKEAQADGLPLVSSGAAVPPSIGTESPHVLSIVTWWDDTDHDEARRNSPDPGVLFPEVVALQPERPLNISASNESWSGTSRRLSSACWLARIFRRRSSFQWRLWTVRHEKLMIVATIQSPDRRPLGARFLNFCEMVLSTMELADQPAWPPDVFLKQVIDVARHHFPLLHTSASRGFSVRLGQSEISLSNFYRMYLRQPENFRRIVVPGLATVVRLQELGPDQLAPSLDLVQERILPILASEEEPRSDERVQMPWVGGLCVGYVIDEDDSYRYVHQRMIEAWCISPESLHSLALQNLRRYAAEHPLEVTMVGDDEDPRLLMPVKPDAYNCSRVLDPDFHVQLRELFGPELIVGVPNRDFFVAATLKDPELISQIRKRVHQDFANMHHPLTKRLLVVSADGVSEYCGP